jgi:hypothetical protein
MKIALKYGMAITVGIMAWTIIAHALIKDPQSNIHSLGAFSFFNLLHFAGIFLGINELERQKMQKPTFKEGIKQGVAISFVYAVGAALFFVGVLFVVGTKWLAAEAVKPSMPMWLIGLQAFGGLVILTMIFGLVYSALISFFLAKRISDNP